jgi:hypothetical protein
MKHPSPEAVIKATERWLRDFVVALDLCPFARFPLEAGKIIFTVSVAQDTERLTEDLLEAIKTLEQRPEIETTLLIHPSVLTEFDAYLDYVAAAEASMAHLGYEGIFQIASFHPDYCFDGEAEDDAANFTNRSPYPMLHLLREASLTQVIDARPDITEVPQRNIRRLRELGLKGLNAYLSGIAEQF